MEVTETTVAPEVVIPLSAMLETPNEPEVEEEVVAETAEVKVEAAEVIVEKKIEDAEIAGATQAELNELRGLLRELRNDNISLKTRLGAAERVQKGEFGEDGKDIELSEIEKYQTVVQQMAQKDFSEILAVMEVNPKYEDLATVCTANNFEDIFERVATYRSGENGTDFSTELVKVKAEVWSLPNPYKYMYETIKEYHPKFARIETKTEEPKKEKENVSAKEILKKQVVTAPGSVANIGGGDETKGGWTSEKIDSMPESDLHKVPKDIYLKWLSGDLD